MERLQLTDDQLLKAMEALTVAIGNRIAKHGRDAYASMHEAQGVLSEEVTEVNTAIHEDNEQDFAKEMIQVAVVGVIAVASMVAGAEKTEAELGGTETPVTTSVDETNEEIVTPDYDSVVAARQRAQQILKDRFARLQK